VAAHTLALLQRSREEELEVGESVQDENHTLGPSLQVVPLRASELLLSVWDMRFFVLSSVCPE